MKSRALRPYILRSIATLSVILAGAAALAWVHSPPKSGATEEAEWDVQNPPGPRTSVVIDTEETTWSNVDVSPDGTTIVFDMLGDLYTVPISGGEAQPLTEGIAWNIQPRFSPDGSKIAFISDREGADNLFVMNADGTEPRAISEEQEHLVHNPYWHPGGDYVVAKKGFTSTRSIPAGEIWMFHQGGGGGLQLIERPNGEQDQKNIAEPAFSPDGRYVYFSQDMTPGLAWQYNKDSTGSIFAIRRFDRVRGEVETIVSGPGGAIRPIPAPDGTHLAFVKRSAGLVSALYLKDLESGREWSVYDHLERDLQEANGSQGNTPAYAFTPDSRSLVLWSAGKIRRLDIATGKAEIIPVRIRVEKQIQKALRFPVDVDPDRFPVRMIRWAQISPDGRTALFQALGKIYVKEIESGSVQRLTDQEEHFEYYPRFSPDGSRVAYVTWDDEELGSVRVRAVGGRREQVVTTSPGHYIEPAFAPDGERLVYRKVTGGYILPGEWSKDPGIYVTSLETGEPERVSKTGFAPQFAAEGDRVLFSEIEDDKLALSSVDLEGNQKRTHLNGTGVNEFSISLDGGWVAFTAQYDAYVAPFAITGKPVEIGPKSTALPVKRVSRRAGEFLHWSGDGATLRWSHGASVYARDLNEAFAFLEGAPDALPEPVETPHLDLSFLADADRPQGVVALVGARIVTMRAAESGQEVIQNGTIVIEGHRIVSVGPSGAVGIPDTATVIDLAGKTILPGLIDVHAHGAMANNELIPQQNWIHLANLAFGVTTTHDPSNDTSEIFAAAEMQRAGQILAPRIFSTGTILYGAHAPGYFAAIDSYDDAEFHVRRLKEVGAISVKSYQQPRREQRQQVIAAARKLGMMVVPEGGAKFQHNMNEIVDGHTGIEHAIPLLRGYDDVIQLWAASETGYTPTFVVAYGGISGENYFYAKDEVWKDEHLMRYTPRFVVEPRAMRRETAPDDHWNHIHVAEFAKTLRDAGVPITIGAHGQRAGLAAHWEMWMMEQGGFTPWEALRGATIDGARYIGMDAEIGSLEAGKLADLFVVDGDPLTRLRDSENVSHVMLGGRLYDATTMNEIAPGATERPPFFFEKEGGETIHPATLLYFEERAVRHGWRH